MDTIPKIIEDIINNYKYQIEHIEKFQFSLDEINKIYYNITHHEGIILSRRSMCDVLIYNLSNAFCWKDKKVEYYQRNGSRRIYIDSYYIYNNEMTIHTIMISKDKTKNNVRVRYLGIHIN